ncbi:1375_t:CDS:2 [Ambispora gerdemannii]|uniref:1375_t:CDS:1 n=1 Tax=Ambispora gerdemannii TaxID=144530 RepID=A0A9N8ZSR4_9GLOM|nr:1375_t:CDS:2 [Ambispora gerdemannii]
MIIFRYIFFVTLTLALNAFENVNSQPPPRYGHTANFIEKERKIYFIGGINANNPSLVLDVLVLDLSSNVSVQSIPSAITVSGYTPVAWGTSVVDGTKIFYFGGVIFNISSSIFPAVNPPRARRNLNSVLDQNKKWHIYGGSDNILDDPRNLMLTPLSLIPTHDLNVHYLDFSTTNEFTFIDKPKPETSSIKVRYEYTATAIGNNIIYIGGKTAPSTFVGMDEIWIFNSDTSEWKKAKNVFKSELVPKRGGHTAVKLNNTSILIYGGYSDPSIMNNNNAVALLRIQNFEDFTSTWSLPVTDTPYPIPYWHTATIYDRYMIVAYGKFPDASTPVDAAATSGATVGATSGATVGATVVTPSTTITILDTRDLKWVQAINQSLINQTGGPNGNTSDQDTSVPEKNNVSGGKKNNTGSIVGGVIGGLLGVALLAALGFFYYRKKNTQAQIFGWPKKTIQSNGEPKAVVKERSLPNIPIQPVLLTPPLTNLNTSSLPSVESRKPLDVASPGPTLLHVPLFSSV